MTWCVVHLKTLCGAVYAVSSGDLRPGATVADIKVLAATASGIPACRQRLVYCGQIMSDDDAVVSYNFMEETVVHLIDDGLALAAGHYPGDVRDAELAAGARAGAGMGARTGLEHCSLAQCRDRARVAVWALESAFWIHGAVACLNFKDVGRPPICAETDSSDPWVTALTGSVAAAVRAVFDATTSPPQSSLPISPSPDAALRHPHNTE